MAISESTQFWLILGATFLLPPVLLLVAGVLALLRGRGSWVWGCVAVAVVLSVCGIAFILVPFPYRQELRASAMEEIVAEDNVRAARIFLALGMDRLGARSSLQESLFRSAVYNGSEEVVRCLLERGQKPDQFETVPDWMTPMGTAAVMGHLDVLRVLAAYGGNADVQSEEGATPLHEAAQWQMSDEIFAELVKLGADVNARERRGRTPLHEAAFSGNVEATRWLIERGAIVDATDKYGYSPLHTGTMGIADASVLFMTELKRRLIGRPIEDAEKIAATLGVTPPLELLDELIAAGADINAPANNRDTALHLAAYRGYTPLVQHLLVRGADPTLRNASGETPLDVAVREGNREAARILREWMAKGAGNGETKR